MCFRYVLVLGARVHREVPDLLKLIPLRIHEETDCRFRIEFAEYIASEDIPRFGQLGVIVDLHSIHMSSRSPWAVDRLDKERIQNGTYMWSDLIDHGTIIVNGTDAPVESGDPPLTGFTQRFVLKTSNGKPKERFKPMQAMTHIEALKSYTLWTKYGAFMEAIFSSKKVAG